MNEFLLKEGIYTPEEYLQFKEILKFGDPNAKYYPLIKGRFEAINRNFENYMIEKNSIRTNTLLSAHRSGGRPNFFIPFRRASTYIPRNEYKKMLTKFKKLDDKNKFRFNKFA